MLSEQEINYRTSDVAPEVTKKHIFFKIVGNVLDIIRKHLVVVFKLDWKALCIGGDKLNPFALPHRVVARAP